MSTVSSYIALYVSLLMALIGAIFPLPLVLNAFRPDWVLLVLFYWVLAIPHRVSLGHGVVIGLMLDLLLGSILGVHALLFSLLAYVVSLNYQRIRYFTIVQNTLLIGALVLFSKLILYWVASNFHEIVLHKSYFWSVFSSMLIWPWFYLFMRYWRLRFNIT